MFLEKKPQILLIISHYHKLSLSFYLFLNILRGNIFRGHEKVIANNINEQNPGYIKKCIFFANLKKLNINNNQKLKFLTLSIKYTLL